MFSAEILMDRVVTLTIITRYNGGLINDLMDSFNFTFIYRSKHDPKLPMGSLFSTCYF